MKKSVKGILIAVGAVVLAAIIVVVVLFGTSKVVFTQKYSRNPLPDYSIYLADAVIAERMNKTSAIAISRNSHQIYCNGGYIATGEENKDIVVYTDEGELVIDAAMFNKLTGLSASGTTPEQIAESIGKKVQVYDQKVIIFSDSQELFDEFNEIYTLEAFYQRLKGGTEDDILNGTIDLPSVVSNNVNNSIYYTEGNLNLGLQTSVYFQQLGESTVAAGPCFVAGQGAHSTNNTLVRIFNQQQACVTQFLAYDAKVTGGVQVTAAEFNGNVYIGTAAYQAKYNEAKSIKIFDTFGTLLGTIKPAGLTAPYVISSGDFLNDGNEYIVCASSFQVGKEMKVHVYDPESLELVKDVSIDCGFSIAGEEYKLSCSQLENGQVLSVYFTNLNKNVNLDLANGKAQALNLEIYSNVTGIFKSAFGTKWIGSLDEEKMSSVVVYSDGVANYDQGYTMNVGWRENRFYSTYAESNPDGYVDYGRFNHMRSDLSINLMGEVSKVTSEKYYQIPYMLDEMEFSDFVYEMSPGDIKQYHNIYNMWEPCFTHRWNRIAGTTVLSKVVDPVTNMTLYTSIGKDNKTGEYIEFDSSFIIATYADAIPELEKIRIYPLRTFLQSLAIQFRSEEFGEPEKLISVSPVHEQEINVPSSVGDYHPNMIKGFYEYLISMYGSLENINKRFGTDFKSEEEFDAPRFEEGYSFSWEKRGDWDVYGKSDFFTQWSLYTRFMINKRIMEAYREALLAGFPPEAINAHQIPEGDAVSGFLGDADTRISPVDVVTVCGTAYGGTRYGVFFNDPNNFLALAHGAGHNNITLGEYSSLSTSFDNAYNQLKYMRDNGVKMTHMIIPIVNEVEKNRATEAEKNAILKLQEENEPRTSSTGGTGDMVAYISEDGSTAFDIIQIGDDDMNGLLKSIDEEGYWEGTVYLTPFHSQIEVEKVSMKKSGKKYTSETIKSLQCGDQVEVTLEAAYSKNNTAKIRFSAYNDGYLMPESVVEYDLTNKIEPYRYVLSNQIPLEDVTIVVEFIDATGVSLTVNNLNCTAQYESIARKYFGDFEFAAHIGGVSFDIF